MTTEMTTGANVHTSEDPSEGGPDISSSVNLMPIVWGVFLVSLTINALNFFTWCLSL